MGDGVMAGFGSSKLEGSAMDSLQIVNAQAPPANYAHYVHEKIPVVVNGPVGRPFPRPADVVPAPLVAVLL
jgi:hypothetical protein